MQKGHGNRARAARLVERVAPAAVHGLKRAACVAVGEKHSLALQRWCCRPLVAWPFNTLAPEEAGGCGDNSLAQQVSYHCMCVQHGRAGVDLSAAVETRSPQASPAMKAELAALAAGVETIEK